MTCRIVVAIVCVPVRFTFGPRSTVRNAATHLLTLRLHLPHHLPIRSCPQQLVPRFSCSSSKRVPLLVRDHDSNQNLIRKTTRRRREVYDIYSILLSVLALAIIYLTLRLLLPHAFIVDRLIAPHDSLPPCRSPTQF